MSSAGTAQIDEAALLQELLPGFKQEVLDKVAKTVRVSFHPEPMCHAVQAV